MDDEERDEEECELQEAVVPVDARVSVDNVDAIEAVVLWRMWGRLLPSSVAAWSLGAAIVVSPRYLKVVRPPISYSLSTSEFAVISRASTREAGFGFQAGRRTDHAGATGRATTGRSSRKQICPGRSAEFV